MYVNLLLSYFVILVLLIDIQFITFAIGTQPNLTQTKCDQYSYSTRTRTTDVYNYPQDEL